MSAFTQRLVDAGFSARKADALEKGVVVLELTAGTAIIEGELFVDGALARISGTEAQLVVTDGTREMAVNSAFGGATPAVQVISAHDLIVCTDNTERLRVGSAGGMIIGNPTGGNKGNGTLNATAVYDDNVQLTCPALAAEFLDRGEIDLAKWDAMVPDLLIPEERAVVPVMEEIETAAEVLDRDADGSLVRRQRPVKKRRQKTELVPVYDEQGKGLYAVEEPVTQEIVTPARMVERRHEAAHLFSAMLKEGFDPRDPAAYIAKMRADQALPGMPTQADWKHGELSMGAMFSRLWLASEFLALALANMNERIVALEARS